MHRIDTATAQKDKFGAGKNGFTRGNPQTGVPATDLDDDYFDTLQEELAAIVEAAGDTLDKAQRNQVLIAAQKLFAPANDTIKALAALAGAANKVPYFTGPNAATLTDLTSVGRQIIGKATIAEVLTYLTLKGAAKLDVATPAEMQAGTSTTLLPSVAAVMSLFSKRTFAAADYIRIPDVPGGFIIQWGSYTPTGGTQTINLPVAFPTMNLGTVGVMAGTATIFGYVTTQNNGLGAFNLHTRNATGNLVATLCFTISLGW